MIALLHAALAAAGYDATPEELADILWLAARPRAPARRTEADGPDPAGLALAGRERAGRWAGQQEETQPRTLYAAADWTGAAGAAVSPTRVATPRALPDARALARSLRPLRSSVRSRTALRLDVGATVTAMADGFRDVVLTPAREPLLDLTLIVDDGVSMAVWHDAARELHRELHRLRAFRRVRVLGMDTDDPAGPRLTAEPYRAGAPPAQPVPGERALLVVLTDGVGHTWRTGAAQERLMRWAAKGPTAVFHVLPAETWAGTGLPTVRLMASAARPAVGNRHIRLRHPKLPRGTLPVPSPPLPVVDVMRGTSTRAWARLVGAPAGEAALHFYDPGQLDVPSEEPADEGSVEEALEDFLSAASTQARRLAAHLACAGTALTVPLMRLVQASAVPASGPEHLAEVFLSGMLTPYAPVLAEGTDPLPHEVLPWNQRAFAYPAPVADALRELVRRSEERTTRDLVTGYLARRDQPSGAGAALVSDSEGVLRARDDLPLGRVGPRWTAGAGRQVPLSSLIRPLDGVLERLGLPPLDWVEEAVAEGRGGAQRAADLLIQAGELREVEGELRVVLETLAQELGRRELATAYRLGWRPRFLGPSSRRPYFFLSYASVPSAASHDSEPDIWVRRFFRDLTDHVRNMTSFDPDSAGFMDRSVVAGRIWSDELTDALGGCRVFVPLLSPRYFTSPWCGREWTAFQLRAMQPTSQVSAQHVPIVPVMWVPVMPGQVPKSVRSLQYLVPDDSERYQHYGIYGLMKLRSFSTEYQTTVLRLAQRIVAAAERTPLEPGDRVDIASVPDAFKPLVRRGDGTADPADDGPTRRG